MILSDWPPPSVGLVTPSLDFKVAIFWSSNNSKMVHDLLLFLLLVRVSWTIIGQPGNSVLICGVYSPDKLLFSFVRGQDSTIWDIVWVSPQGHRSASVGCHFLLQAPQCECPCSARKRFSRYHCCRWRSKPGCLTVCGHTQVRVDGLSRLPVTLPSTFDVNCLQIQPHQLPGCQS